MRLDRKTLTADAMDNNLVSMGNDGTVEKDVEYIEKTYFKHVDKNFIGVIVGYRDVNFKSYPVAKQVARIGNSVVPIMAQKLVEANCPYLKVGERVPNLNIDDGQGQLRFA